MISSYLPLCKVQNTIGGTSNFTIAALPLSFAVDRPSDLSASMLLERFAAY